MTAGIYCIENLENGMKYIGMSSGIDSYRLFNHKSMLKRNVHHNTYLQNAYNKYGKNAFKFWIVEKCDKDNLPKREMFYIKEWNTKAPNGYNLTSGGDGGYNPSQETREKQSKAKLGTQNALGHTVSQEARKRMSLAKRNMSAETKAKMSNSAKGNTNWLGKHHSEKTKEKIRDLNIGKHHSEETKRKQSESHRGKSFSEEHKKNLSIARKKREKGKVENGIFTN
jgi:group I intron endonuclease